MRPERFVRPHTVTVGLSAIGDIDVSVESVRCASNTRHWLIKIVESKPLSKPMIGT